jgi:hypothetical protein
VNTRTLALVLLALEGAAAIVPWIPAPEGIAWPMRLVAAALAVALLPGAALALWLVPERCWRPTELVAVAFGAAVALVQLALIASLTLHFSAVVTLGAMALLTVAALVRTTLRAPGLPDCRVAARRDWPVLARRPAAGRHGGVPSGPAIVTTWPELAWWAGVLGLAAFLYVEGAPYRLGEDFLHVGVIRRLAELPDPAIDNIYFAPGVIYTYPFPGIHYLIALISRWGDVDPLFAYHKLRFFWGPIALAMVAVIGRQLFGSMTWGLACGATALAFVVTGTFAEVEGFFWGQLTPFSHASDVAMGVLLPAALVYMLAFLADDDDRQGSRFFFAGSLALALMLTIVHVRELIQVLVYLGAFVLALLVVRGNRALLLRSCVLLGAVLAIAVGFNVWHAAAVGHIDSIVGARRAELVEVVRNDGGLGLFVRAPTAYFDGFMPNAYVTFREWNPFLLLAAAPVLMAFRASPAAWLVAASLLCYVLIIRFPLFGAPYIYLTYFEILFTPIRNVVFFLHVLAGAALFLATAVLGRAGFAGVLLALAGSLAIAGAWRLPRIFFEQHQDLLFVPVIALLVWTLVRARRRAVPETPRATASLSPRRAWAQPRRWLGAAAALTAVGMVAVWFLTGTPARAVQVRWSPDVSGPERIFHEWRFTLADGLWREGTTWYYSLLDTSTDNVRRLVQSRSVLDTHEINRTAFVLNESAPIGTRYTWAGAGLPIIGSPDGFQVTVLLLVGVAVLLLRREGPPRAAAADTRDVAWRHPRPLLFGTTVVMLAGLTWTPDLSPLVIEGSLRTPDAIVTSFGCDTATGPAPYAPAGVQIVVTGMMSCPPSPALMKWVREHVPAAGVFAANTWNSYPPSVFFPQQYLGWARLTPSFLSPEQIFGPYLQFYRRSLAMHGGQPMFNDRETAADRRRFVDALGVTHVLVDPAYYDVMTRTLAGNADFTKQYDDGRWAVFAVHSGRDSRQAE